VKVALFLFFEVRRASATAGRILAGTLAVFTFAVARVPAAVLLGRQGFDGGADGFVDAIKLDRDEGEDRDENRAANNQPDAASIMRRLLAA